MQHPQPEYRMHKTISSGEFAPGATIAQDGTIRAVIPIASAAKVRVRFQCDVGGSLVGKFLSPGLVPGDYTKFGEELDGTDAVATTGLPAAVTVTADTEALLEVNDLSGEAYLLIEFTEADVAAGTVTHANYCQL